MSKLIYILDPGHGGVNPKTGEYVTPGKRSPVWEDGAIYYEGVGNRAIVRIVAKKLKELGIKYAFTVTPDDWRDISLTDRIKAANAAHKKSPCVLISVHSNGASSAQAHGYEVYTSPGQTTSDKYATIFYNEFAKIFPELKGRPGLGDGDPDKEELFAVLKVNCPAFLIESMFHTNPEECKILMTYEGQEKVAQAVVNTILQIEKS